MKKNKKGFTLVELICVIVILGLLITIAVLAISNMVEKSKKSSTLMQERIINKACESYIQENRDKAPKVIGESVNISLKELKNAKYLNDDIYDANKDSCMKDSFVLVYKRTNTDFSYLPYLYCGDEEVDNEVEIPIPTVKVLFIDDNNSNDSSLIFNNPSTSRIYVEMTGGTTKKGNTLQLDAYRIVISMRTRSNNELKEYYNSGLVHVSDKDSVTIDNKLINYVNMDDATSISVTVIAANTVGGVKEVTSSAETNN